MPTSEVETQKEIEVPVSTPMKAESVPEVPVFTPMEVLLLEVPVDIKIQKNK